MKSDFDPENGTEMMERQVGGEEGEEEEKITNRLEARPSPEKKNPHLKSNPTESEMK